jgi:putative ABC transport system permease protein
LTRNLADLLYPDENPVGKQIQSGGDDPEFNRIVGIVERMHSSWPLSDAPERVMLIPGDPFSTRSTDYLVRAEPGQAQAVFKTVENTLLGVNRDRLVTVRTLKDIKAETYASLTAFTQLLGGLSVLLIIVTSLGIVGLTSFSVTQRTHEIGTRRALGATRLAIVRHFLVENWLVTGIGLSIGLILTVGLNFALAKWADVPRIGVVHIAVGIAVLWGAGLLAALAPALRAMLVSPVIATRNVY